MGRVCQGCQRFETSVFFSEKINISTTGHMGPEHASREKKFTMVNFLIFVQKNVSSISDSNRDRRFGIVHTSSTTLSSQRYSGVDQRNLTSQYYWPIKVCIKYTWDQNMHQEKKNCPW